MTDTGMRLTNITGALDRAPKSFASYATAKRFVAGFEEKVGGTYGRVMFVPRESDGRIVVILFDTALSHDLPIITYIQHGFFVVG